MRQGKVGDFVLIIDEKDSNYLKIGKITQTIYAEHESFIKTYIINFVTYTQGLPLQKSISYNGYIFEEYRAKILKFKE